MFKNRKLIDALRIAKASDRMIVDALYALDTKAKAKQKTERDFNYTDDFEIWWKSYPDRSNNSKVNAFVEWRKLSEDDQLKATKALVPYAKKLRKEKDLSCVHAERFLRERRFDGFEIVEQAVPEPASALDISNNAHKFMLKCRSDGASESDITYWKDKFTVRSVGGSMCCVVQREMGDFDRAFRKTLDSDQMLLWFQNTYDTQVAKGLEA